MNLDLKYVDQWPAEKSMIANAKKTKTVVIGSRQAIKKASKIRIYLNKNLIDEVVTFDYLGVCITYIYSWDQHVNKLS